VSVTSASPSGAAAPLRARWLGRVRFNDAHAVQRALFRNTTDSYLLLLEHHPVYTVGLRGALDHLRVPAEDLGAEVVATDRGGDVTWHGPGQLVGYPILSTD
jgi:lipoate-protein ligase B